MAAGTMNVGGESVVLLNDDLFGRVRSTLGYGEWAMEALRKFDFKHLAVRVF